MIIQLAKHSQVEMRGNYQFIDSKSISCDRHMLFETFVITSSMDPSSKEVRVPSLDSSDYMNQYETSTH